MQNFTFKSVLILITFFLSMGLSKAQELPINWTGDSGIDIYKDTDIIHGGTSSAKILLNTEDQNICTFVNQTSFPVEAGEYVASAFWGISNIGIKLRGILVFDNGDIEYGSFIGKTDGDEKIWEEGYFDVKVPAGATSVKVGVKIYDDGKLFTEGQECYVDDFSLEYPLGTVVTLENADLETWPAPKPEPTNHPTNIIASTKNSQLRISWDDAIGDVLADKYLVMVSSEDNITPPVDGTVVADDTDLTDGTAVINVEHDVEHIIIDNANEQTSYFIQIYPFTTGNTDYKLEEVVTRQTIVHNSILFADFDSDWDGFTPISISGDQEWILKSDGGIEGTDCARMSGYDNGAKLNEDYLIFPSINLDNSDNELLSFYSKLRFSGIDLKLKYSTDYDPNAAVTDATWTDLDIRLSKNSFGFSKHVDISGINGENVYFAFVYNSTPDDGSYDTYIDNVEILGVSKTPTLEVTYPNGGETIETGTTCKITWNATAFNGQVKIELLEGEEATLLVDAYDASENSYDWVIAEDHKTAANFKIKISGTTEGDPEDTSDNTFEIIEPYVIPQLVITEIMYNPPESGTDVLEFIEIYNPTTEAINLEGVKFTKGIEHTFEAYTLDPESYVVVCVDLEEFNKIFDVDAIQWTNGGLSNGGEEIELKDKYDNVLDNVTYDDAAPWDTAPDGNGCSLTLCDFTADNALAESWKGNTFYVKDDDGNQVYATPKAYKSLPVTAKMTYEGEHVVDNKTPITIVNSSTGPVSKVLWNMGDETTYETADQVVHTYTTEGFYTPELTVSNTCHSSKVSLDENIECIVLPVPDFKADVTEISMGGNVTFTYTGEDLKEDNHITWEFDGGTIVDESDIKNVVVKYDNAGDFSASITMHKDESFITVKITKENYIHVSTGIEDINNTINIFPQPANTFIQIEFKNDGNHNAIIYDLKGNAVREIKETEFGNKINISDLKSGTYLLRITDDNANQKLVKKIIIN
ncbi:MAG: lamin tail domain-containing protein [Hyphomicrobiales bacterium]